MEHMSRDLERKVLGTIIEENIDQGLFDYKLKEDDFFFPENKDLFRAIKIVTHNENPIDMDFLKKEGIPAWQISEAMQYNSFKHNLKPNVEELKDLSSRRAMKRGSREIIEVCDEAGSDKTREQLLEFAISQFTKLEERETPSNEVTGFDMSQIFDDMQDKINRGEDLGIMTGFKDMDAITKGFRGGQLIVIAGRPKMSKSCLAANFALSTIDRGYGCLFFSFELRADEMVHRFMSMISGVPLNKLYEGYRGEETDAAKDKLFTDLLTLITGRTFTISELKVRAKSVKNKMAKKGQKMGMIIVDLLTHVKSDRKENRQQEVAEVSRELKLLAQELDVPVVAVSQLNRDLEHRNNPRPKISDLRESGSIEQDADKILLMYRPEYYLSQKPFQDLTKEEADILHDMKGKCEINIAAQRQGTNGIVELEFDGKCVRFRDV